MGSNPFGAIPCHIMTIVFAHQKDEEVPLSSCVYHIKQWARFRLKPNRIGKPWFKGLLVPQNFNGLVWIFDKRFGSKTWVYRFGLTIFRFLVNIFVP